MKASPPSDPQGLKYTKPLVIRRLGILITGSPYPDRGSSLVELKPLPSPRVVVSGSVEAGTQWLKPLEDVTR